MAKVIPKPASAFTGRWRTVSMDGWDVDYVGEEGPAFMEFGAALMGDFRFGLTSGNIDDRITERGQPAAEWTWEGMDEMDACAGDSSLFSPSTSTGGS